MSDERATSPSVESASNQVARGRLVDMIAEVACMIFQAKAASVILHNASTSELVVAAAVGEGAEGFVGTRIPQGVGIAGGVFADAEPVSVDDVVHDERFGRAIAAATGYMPTGLMAAPLMHDGRTLGVIEVLDRPQFSRFSQAEVDLLEAFARMSAAAIDQSRESPVAHLSAS